ncbi:lipoprotein [Salmonella enterica subsp. enterica serovar Typhi]|nr:lipoprotein [Salmonella enterica subsp. enterica serovar Typhi]
MQYRNLFCLFSLSLLLPPAWGCRLSEPPHNVYQRQGSGVVYLQPEEENNLSLPEVNFKRLRRLPNSLINPATQDEWDREPPLTDLTTDYVHTSAQAIFPRFSYYSDGRVILYGGKIMRNPPGTPSVDVASFRAFGKVGVDKNSLYDEGKRTDDNGGENRVNLQSLRKVEFSS